MNELKYIADNLLYANIPKFRAVAIVNACCHKGLWWNSDFSVELSKKYPQAKKTYMKTIMDESRSLSSPLDCSDVFGSIQRTMVSVMPMIMVYNVAYSKDSKVLNLRQSLENVVESAKLYNSIIRISKRNFGEYNNLPWDEIESIIKGIKNIGSSTIEIYTL